AGCGTLFPTRSIQSSMPAVKPRFSLIRAPGAGKAGTSALASLRRAYGSWPPRSPARPLRVLAGELGLRDAGPLELLDPDTLVRRVDVGETVRGAEKDDLGVGHRLVQRAHERDRAAGRDLHRLAAPGRGERCGGGLVRRPGRLGEEALAGLGRRDGEL